MASKEKKPSKETKSEAFEQALRALDTLGDINIVLVPTQATPEMLAKVSRSTGLPIDIVGDVYEMMIKASQEL